MFINLCQTMWAYSCYLTLREREIWVYVIILLIQVIYCTICLLGLNHDATTKESSMQTLGKLVCLCVCGILGYLIGKAYYDFRKSGGLHGLAPGSAKPLLVEDKLVDGAGVAAGVAEGYVNDALDKQDADEFKAADRL